MYDPEFKHGQNFVIATTEEAKQVLLRVCIILIIHAIALPPGMNFYLVINPCSLAINSDYLVNNSSY